VLHRSEQNGRNLLEAIQATAFPQLGHFTMASVMRARTLDSVRVALTRPLSLGQCLRCFR